MSFPHPQTTVIAKTKIRAELAEKFWRQETKELFDRNRRLKVERRLNLKELTERRRQRRVFVITCMDERLFFIEEALKLLPGEGIVYGSAGAKIATDKFEEIYGDLIERAIVRGRQATVYLTTHECATDPTRGCATFRNDVKSQVSFFTSLRQAVALRHPEAWTHAFMTDSSNGDLWAIETDEHDPGLASLLDRSERPDWEIEEIGRAGYGIYLGEAYRAWVERANTYFRISSLNPDIPGDVAMAIFVMRHHSSVDLARTPVILHVDYPLHTDQSLVAAARLNLDRALERVLTSPDVLQLVNDGHFKVIKTETNLDTWDGRIIE